MARFYGEIHGQARTPATRIGNNTSGLHAHIRGWDVGIEVECHSVEEYDIIEVYLTGGSNGTSKRKKLISAVYDTAVNDLNLWVKKGTLEGGDAGRIALT